MKKRIQQRLLVAALAALLLISGCGKDSAKNAAQTPPNVGVVSVMTVAEQSLPYYYETSGTVKAQTVSQIAPKVMGTVTALLVKAGDRVTAGQLLATLENNDSAARLAAAQAGYREAQKGKEVASRNLALQETTYERYRKLFADEAIPRQQFDQVETQTQIARLDYERATEGLSRAAAQQREAQANDDYTRLTAPTNGIVTEKRLEVGSMLQAGTPAITVEDNSAFLLEAYLEENQKNTVFIGMPVKVRFDSGNRLLDGQITEIVPSVDSSSRTFLVKAVINGTGDLQTGNYAKLLFLQGEKKGAYVPLDALVSKGELTGVYVVAADKRVWYRMVRLGQRHDQLVEVIAGLKPGDQVVVKNAAAMVDGGIAQEVNPL